MVLGVAALAASSLALFGCQSALPSIQALLGVQARVMGIDILGLPTSGRLDASVPQTATVLARDGSVLAEISDIHLGRRVSVPLSEISPHLVRATISTEDRRFYHHQGVDLVGLLRAVHQNLASDGLESGASTLDMQLVRNLFLADERFEQTLSRKLREAAGALQLNRRFSKPEILEAYLNVVYYGHRAYGAEAAAQTYFGKSARDLTLAEAALLAGLPQSPSEFDPILHPEAAKARQAHVLGQMVLDGAVTAEEAAQAWSQPLALAPSPPPQVRAPHWVDYVQQGVRERYGPEALFTGGLRIQTTLDPDIQALAEQIVAGAEGLRRTARADNTALVVLDTRTSQVLAMVGSKDFWDASVGGQVNLALAGRQPGSSIKPLVYLAGFERGLNPAVEVEDRITAFSAPPGQPAYVPVNWENRYYGRVTLRDALGNSLNVPAVKVLKYTGVPAVLDLARRLGITTLDGWDPRWLSLTLGGGQVRLLELVGAYATIAREGRYLPVEPLLRVETARGELLFEADRDPPGRQVVDPRIAYQVVHVLGDPGARLVTFGPNTPLNLGRPHMVKTGTTDDYRDTWTVGCVPQVCVGVWMGNTGGQPMGRVSSSLTAGRLWVDMMRALIDRYGYEPVEFPRPEGVIVTRAPNVGRARGGQGDHEEVFVAGREERFFLNMDWRRPD